MAERDHPDDTTAAVRRFSRFYMARVGAIGDYLGLGLSLTESRVLYELCARKNASARDICRDLKLDEGYLSRILKSFERQRFVTRRRAGDDRRRREIAVAPAGKRMFALLNARSEQEVGALIATLSAPERRRLVGAMDAVEALLEGKPPGPFELRSPRPGDFGWIVEAHGRIYAAEYGWGEKFEALVAEVVAAFAKSFDPAAERCWIAARGEERLGSVFVSRASAEVAKLRMLILEPSARGMGLGRRLVEEAVGFVQAAGYGTLSLWTQQNLKAARAIYASLGFRLLASEAHDLFGPTVVGETWELDLGERRGGREPAPHGHALAGRPPPQPRQMS